MTRRLALKVSANGARQIREAAAWWRANRPAAREAVREELTKAFELVRAQPGIGATAANARLQGVQRVYLSRIGYHLYYKVSSSAAHIEILALWHASRGAAPPL